MRRGCVVPIVILTVLGALLFHLQQTPKRIAYAYAERYGCAGDDIVATLWESPLGGWGGSFTLVCVTQTTPNEFEKLTSQLRPNVPINTHRSYSLTAGNTGKLPITDTRPQSQRKPDVPFVESSRDYAGTSWSRLTLAHFDVRGQVDRFPELKSKEASYVIAVKMYVTWYETPELMFE